jgi:O-methyltransferase involved in polyketide biosynthesis
MEENQEMGLNGRNFNTISPSAKSLLFMKGHTNIPYARQAAELIMLPEKYMPDFNKKDITFWARVVHFESRYWSINQLLTELPIKNILELSSGYSFRSFDKVQNNAIKYIDTDLPELIDVKKRLVTALQKDNEMKGRLEVLPLNALDEKQFEEIVSRFPEGEIVIVNEGLMIYLDIAEKQKLCKIIHNTLKKRGGCWITADIYLKSQHEKLDLKFDKNTKDFFEQHNIEENKFDSFESAKEFFNLNGFEVEKEANVDYSKLSTLKYLKQSAPVEQLAKMGKAGKIQATWRLRVASK